MTPASMFPLWPEGVVELWALDRLVLLIVGHGDIDRAATLGTFGIRRREMYDVYSAIPCPGSLRA